MSRTTDAGTEDTLRGPDAANDHFWVPEDRAPSAAENNFMSFALFAFLILFGLGCFILL